MTYALYVMQPLGAVPTLSQANGPAVGRCVRTMDRPMGEGAKGALRALPMGLLLKIQQFHGYLTYKV